MKTINVSDLNGSALDWAVANAIEWMHNGEHAIEFISDPDMVVIHWQEDWDYEFETEQFKPSSVWSQAGPLIEKHKVSVEWYGDTEEWCADTMGSLAVNKFGQTALIAACRAIVASKFGDTVEVPSELG